MRLADLAIASAALLAGASACSSSSGESSGQQQNPATAPDSGLVACDDPRDQTYAPDMQQAGASGIFTFVLVSSTPAPPADQSNVFVLKVLDASGQPVTGATITVDPTMPTMSHGTSAVTVTPNPDGTYTLEPLYFFMGGLWQTAIHAVAPTPAGAEPDAGSVEDSTSFFFCVPG